MKKWFKKLKTSEKWTLGSVAFLIVGTAIFLLGAYLSGWDIWSWFATPQAFLIYGIIAIFLILVAWYFVRKKLGGGDNE